MKKYKLIKTFPGSPKLGTIEKPVGTIHQMSNGLYGYNISNNPEFWEEVIKKDYEIQCWSNPYNRHEHSLKDRGGWDINSVKRLSDGEVFTVGNKVTYTGGGGWIIDNFSINDDGDHMMAAEGSTLKEEFCCISNKDFRIVKKPPFITEDGIKVKEGDNVAWAQYIDEMWISSYNSLDYSQSSVNTGAWKAFSTIQARNTWVRTKNPNPLFTTEDGVDIFVGDTYYWVHKEHFKVIKDTILHKNDSNAVETGHNVAGNFSTPRAAKEYIMLNKPCLSYGDVESSLRLKDCNKILKLIKTRI